MTATERDTFERTQVILYRWSGAFMFSGLFFMAAMAFGQLGSQLPLMICGAGNDADLRNHLGHVGDMGPTLHRVALRGGHEVTFRWLRSSLRRVTRRCPMARGVRRSCAATMTTGWS